MTWQFKLGDNSSTLNLRDNTTNHGVIALGFYTLKECMKVAGWTCVACGTGAGGSVYTDDVGPRITHALLKTANTNAWFAMRSPDSRKIIIFQRGSSYVYQWRIRIVIGGINSDGTATQIPSAVDATRSTLLCGGGTDASPTFMDFGSGETTGHVIHVACDNANDYSFYMLSYREGNKICYYANLFMEQVAQPAAGDIDPCVYYINPAIMLINDANLVTYTYGWYKIPDGSYKFGNIPANCACYQANTSWTGAMGTDPWTGYDQCLPILFGKNWIGYEGGCFKGYSSNIYVVGTDRGTSSTRTVTTALDKVQVASVLFPWDGTTTPA